MDLGPSSAPRGGRREQGGGAGNDIDVLVVEDDHAVRSSIAEIIRNEGLVVVEAEDGFVALEHLRSNVVGMVLLDLNMPVLDGLGLLDKLDSPPPVVVLTARSYDADIDRRRSKITGYLRKPSHPDVVLTAVRSCLA